MVLFAKVRENHNSSCAGGGAPAQPTDRDKEAATALMAAVEAGNAQRVEELITGGITCETLRAVRICSFLLPTQTAPGQPTQLPMLPLYPHPPGLDVQAVSIHSRSRGPVASWLNMGK